MRGRPAIKFRMQAAGKAANRFGSRLKALRQAAGFTQEELATISGLSVNAVSALERGERRQPHVETLRALAAALDLTGPARDELFAIARAGGGEPHADGTALPVPPTPLVGRQADLDRRGCADRSAGYPARHVDGSGGRRQDASRHGARPAVCRRTARGSAIRRPGVDQRPRAGRRHGRRSTGFSRDRRRLRSAPASPRRAATGRCSWCWTTSSTCWRRVGS